MLAYSILLQSTEDAHLARRYFQVTTLLFSCCRPRRGTSIYNLVLVLRTILYVACVLQLPVWHMTPLPL